MRATIVLMTALAALTALEAEAARVAPTSDLVAACCLMWAFGTKPPLRLKPMLSMTWRPLSMTWQLLPVLHHLGAHGRANADVSAAPTSNATLDAP